MSRLKASIDEDVVTGLTILRSEEGVASCVRRGHAHVSVVCAVSFRILLGTLGQDPLILPGSE